MAERKRLNNQFADEPKQGWAFFEDLNQWRKLPTPTGVPKEYFPSEYGDWIGVNKPASWQPTLGRTAKDSLSSATGAETTLLSGVDGAVGGAVKLNSHGQLQPYDDHGRYGSTGVSAQHAVGGNGGQAFYKALAMTESSLDPRKTNGSHIGLYQMGDYELRTIGAKDAQGNWTGKFGWTQDEFLSTPALQDQAIREWHGKLWEEIKANKLDQYEGRVINDTEITRSGLIAGAHLVGGPNLKEYLRSGGRIVPEDGNHVPVSQYIKRFGGYPVPQKR